MRRRVFFVISVLFLMCFSIALIYSHLLAGSNPPSSVGTGKVLGVHQYKLKDGVDPKDFEQFIAEEFTPTMKQVFPGVNLMVMKGERGEKVGHYLYVFEIDSVQVRSKYWPKPGEVTEAAQQAWAKCGTPCDEFDEKFLKMAERTEYTDYVEILTK